MGADDLLFKLSSVLAYGLRLEAAQGSALAPAAVNGKARLDPVLGKSIGLAICGTEFFLCTFLTGSLQANHPLFPVPSLLGWS